MLCVPSWRWKRLPIPYKIEIFDRNFAFRSFAPIAPQAIEFDYLTMSKVSLKTPQIAAQKGDYARITVGSREVYTGLIDDVAVNDADVTITLVPLQTIFNGTVYIGAVSSGTVEKTLAAVIKDHFVESSDTLQNIPGLQVITSSATSGGLWGDDLLVNFSDLMEKAITAYGVVISMVFSPQEKTLTATIGKVAETAVIEADLPAILSREIILGDSYGQLNKLIVLDDADASRSAIYFLHSDGTVSTKNTDRLYPVFFATVIVSAEDAADFDALASEQAFNALSPQQYDNLIELTASNDSRVFPKDLPIGAVVAVWYNGKKYRSILSGRIIREKTTTLLFGVVRIDLTKKLALQSRKNR